ncbi:DUF1311 domain-containing protein [Rhodobacterales bacterium HKCCE2091]|nr:DUF1311 domain-containing protein [Rhodobacterales bacterium HKCCE2091]
MKAAAFVLAILAAAPALAQDLAFSEAATEACLADGAEPRESCPGRSAGACIEDTEGGYSTVSMGACIWAEYQYWDDRLNASYQELVARSEDADAENAASGLAIASQEQALREMQRAWIVFRDTACDFERSLWGGGTGAGPAGADCLMQETARQVFRLDDALGRGR